MKYIGNLYGNIRGTRKYFDTGKTSEDWDALEKRADYAELKIKKLRESLTFISEYGGQVHCSELGDINCTGHWCAEQARAALGQTEETK